MQLTQEGYYLFGIWNASPSLSEKGSYAMSFFLSLFAGVAVQKNVRDTVPDPEQGKLPDFENSTRS